MSAIGKQAHTAVADSTRLDWLADVQAAALASFSTRGFPTTAEEDWRYTDLSEAARRVSGSVAAPLISTEIEAALLARFAHPSATRVVFVNGEFSQTLSRMPASAGLSVVPLQSAGPAARAAAAGVISRASVETGSLTALNAALLRDGLSITVDRGASLAEPIYVVFAATDAQAVQARLLVDLGAGSRCTIIEHHLSLDASLTNAVTNISCGTDSHLSYVKLQAESDSAINLASQTVRIESGARADLANIDLGALLGRNDLNVELAGRGASVIANGLFFADGNRHVDNHTRIDHCSPDATSRELYRGIVDGHGRGVFNGKVIIHPGADKADARLTNQNLLLSRTAEVDTKPELEIYADDVKCAHGATTGQLDEAAVFYLRSRGIPEDQARHMLIASFAREIVARSGVPAVQALILAMLQESLPLIMDFARPT